MEFISRITFVIAVLSATCFDAGFAQSSGPSECAEYCYGVSHNLNALFKCKLDDYACNCATNTFITEFATCQEGRCTSAEINSDFALLVQHCAAYGVIITLPGVNSALVTATAVATTFASEFALATESASLASVYGDGAGGGVPTDPSFVYRIPVHKAKPVNAGKISGIVVGVVVGLGLIAGAFFLLFKKFKHHHRAGTLPPMLSPLGSPTAEMFNSNPFSPGFYSEQGGMYSPAYPQSPTTFGQVYNPTHSSNSVPEATSPTLQSPVLSQFPRNGLTRPPTIYKPPFIPYNPQDYVEKPPSIPAENPNTSTYSNSNSNSDLHLRNGKSNGLKITTQIPSSSLATDEKAGVDDIQQIGTASYYGEEKKGKP